MKKTVLVYSTALAAAGWLLQWLDYKHAVRALGGEVYVALVALAFAVLGIWVGHRLTPSMTRPTFVKNERAIASLGISEREYEVLTLLAEGCSNREIAERLFVSRNTVKTHLAHLYDKLEVSRRTQAIHKARMLQILG